MGEIQQHVHHLDPEQFAALLAALAKPAPAAPLPADERHAETPFDLGLTPWAFHSPHHGADVVAYIDDRNQVRHVPTSRGTEVPRTWQRVWIEPLS